MVPHANVRFRKVRDHVHPSGWKAVEVYLLVGGHAGNAKGQGRGKGWGKPKSADWGAEKEWGGGSGKRKRSRAEATDSKRARDLGPRAEPELELCVTVPDAGKLDGVIALKHEAAKFVKACPEAKGFVDLITMATTENTRAVCMLGDTLEAKLVSDGPMIELCKSTLAFHQCLSYPCPLQDVVDRLLVLLNLVSSTA